MKKRKKILKRTLSLFLTMTVLSAGVPVYGQEEFSTGIEETEFSDVEIFSSGEVSEFSDTAENFFENVLTDNEEIHYIKGRPLTEEERREQLAPIEELKPMGEVPAIGSDFEASTYALYPERYDAREKGLVTAAKNQNPFGICWAFGMASLLETSLLSQNKGAIDLSEEHLAYFFANRENDPLGNTADDSNHHLGDYHQGGNDYLASLFLTTWSGMTTEGNVPLPTDAGHTVDYTAPIPAEKAYDASVYLTDAAFSDYSVERMKQMLTEKNSVAMMYYMDSKYYNPDTGAYSYPQKIGINHVVVVVGWDDNYSKENFPKACGVTSDGAWIVKNSWGSQWGEEGYFYLSYEDKNISALVTADGTDKPVYDNNYFYDGSSGLQTITLKTGQSMANIFTAKAKEGCAEILGEVNISTFSDNAEYEIQIYTDIKDENDPTSGTPVYSTPYRCYQPLAGVKTVRVPEVPVISGTKYSVVVKNTGEAFKFCCEADARYNNWFSSTAGIKTGQGFFGSTKGVWTDLYSISATPRIKAHTRTLERIPAPTLEAVSEGYTNAGLSWNRISGINGYMIYRSEAGKAKRRIASLSATATSYSDTGLKTGVKYTYTIVPYVRALGKVISGDESAAVSVIPMLSNPVFKVNVSANGYNRVSWSKVPGATAYNVYRKTLSGGWRLLDTVGASVVRFDDKKVKPCTSYRYTVRACRKTSGGSYLSKYTMGDVIKAAPALQKVDSATSSGSGIRLKWKTQDNCDGYRIYRKTKAGSWQSIKTISSRSTSTYLDKTVSKGVSYYYAVRAYVKEPYGYVYSRYTASSAVKRK